MKMKTVIPPPRLLTPLLSLLLMISTIRRETRKMIMIERITKNLKMIMIKTLSQNLITMKKKKTMMMMKKKKRIANLTKTNGPTDQEKDGASFKKSWTRMKIRKPSMRTISFLKEKMLTVQTSTTLLDKLLRLTIPSMSLGNMMMMMTKILKKMMTIKRKRRRSTLQLLKSMPSLGE